MWANHLCRTGAAWVGPDFGGKNVANPTSSILSTAMLLDRTRAAQPQSRACRRAALIEQTVDDVLQNPATRPAIWRGSVRPTRSHNGKKSS